MILRSITFNGHRAAPRVAWAGDGRAVQVGPPGPATTALGDGLAFFFAATSGARLHALASSWGLGPSGEPPPAGPLGDELLWDDAAVSFVDPSGDRTWSLAVEIAPDPPLFARLRAEVGREPRLAAGLAAGGALGLTLSALFTRDLRGVAVSWGAVSVGGESFSLRAGERARWAESLLAGLGPRFHRFDPHADPAPGALAALLAREGHGAYQRFAAALGPAGPALRAATDARGAPLVLAGERPLARCARVVDEDARLAAAVHLSGAELLWAETDRAWVDGLCEGEASALEQVFRVVDGGTPLGAGAGSDALGGGAGALSFDRRRSSGGPRS
jgi:hypothetical protein